MENDLCFEALVSADELKGILQQHHWSQKAVSEVMGIGRGTLKDWMNGKVPRNVVHMALRYLVQQQSGISSTYQIIPKKKKGRPLSDEGFPLEKAKCPCPGCQAGNRQMHKARKEPYDHVILGKVQPVFCVGTHAHPHPRVTRWLDSRRGRLWDASDWPIRKKLVAFESKRIKEALDVMGDDPDPESVLNCLAKCTDSPDGKKGCGGFLANEGPHHVIKALTIFVCSREACELQWRQRYFDASGQEIRPFNRRLLPRKRSLAIPPGARNCPVCAAKLNSPKEVSIVGGETYSPPLLKFWCPNPQNISHRSEHRSRKGQSFYYDKKRSRFVQVYTRARVQRGPEFSKPCRKHGRMDRTTINSIDRTPRRIREHFDMEKALLPFYRDYCPCTEVWLTSDGQKTPRLENHWKTARPFRAVRPASSGKHAVLTDTPFC